MIPNPFDSGKLEKMIIQAHKHQVLGIENPQMSDDEDDKYMVQVNPDKYTVNYQINYDQRAAHGNSGSEARHANTAPPTLQFEFLFDGTGVIPASAGPLDNVPIAGAVAGLFSDDEEYDVTRELHKFAHVVYDYSGEEHRPRIVRLSWGKLVFDGVLKSLTIDYKLFKSDGTPLRAMAKTTFDGTITDVLREYKEDKSSPDLTHVRTVVAGDKLPLITHNIYKDPKYYIEIARENKLFNFRRLSEGSQISLPPVDKSTK